MKDITDFDLQRLSSFIDGEMSREDIRELVLDMGKNTELKECYLKMVELSHASSQIKTLSFTKKLSNLSLNSLLKAFFEKLVAPVGVFAAGVVMSYTVVNSIVSENYENNETAAVIAQAISSAEAKQTLLNIQNEEIIQFASRHFSNTSDLNILPVGYAPNWVPSGFVSDPARSSKFINNSKRKQFSIFVTSPEAFSLPDGAYRKENFILIKETHNHNGVAHTLAVFGDIDIESGKKILNSIEVK